jgi:two-component system, cell cycle response regulator
MRRVLLIDDDRLQHRLTQGYFANFKTARFELEWAESYQAGLEKLVRGDYAACLLDYQLGARDGLELIREAARAGCRTPIIFLTAETGANVDMEAMEAGALDYLVKGEFNAQTLERSLRYAVKLGETLEELRRLATRDPLTGLFNRREIERLFAEEAERARRFERSLGVVLLDLDHFKRVNDEHGHAAGDSVLRNAASRIASVVRTVDRVGRLGGEEFIVMLPEAGASVSAEIADRIVQEMAARPFEVSDNVALRVTMSAGSAAAIGSEIEIQQLLERADQALYKAKELGRNRFVAAPPVRKP